MKKLILLVDDEPELRRMVASLLTGAGYEVAEAADCAQARAAGIALWNKPSYACLATRIPVGTTITREDLRRVEAGESLLFSLGYTDFRLRLREQYALLQVREEELERAQAQLPELQRQLAPLFPQVVLDPVPRPRRES